MIIINGRKTEDPFGKITLYQWNGQAVVDYAISSFELLDKITYFKVGEYSSFISDHCPLFFEIHSKVLTREKYDNLREAPNMFYIYSQDREKLIKALKSQEITCKLTVLNGNSGDDPQSLVSEISKTLLEACSKAEIKPKRKSTKLGGGGGGGVKIPGLIESVKNSKIL